MNTSAIHHVAEVSASSSSRADGLVTRLGNWEPPEVKCRLRDIRIRAYVGSLVVDESARGGTTLVGRQESTLVGITMFKGILATFIASTR